MTAPMIFRRLLPVIAVSMAVSATACVSEVEEEEAVAAESAIATRIDATPGLLVRDPKTLVPLVQGHGLGFAARVGGAGDDASLGALARTPLYGSLAAHLERDLDALKASDRESGVGFQYAHRLFDRAWLRSPKARFELVGVVNRPDLAQDGHCGEVRLVYRMAYTASRTFSRLPMTVLLAYRQRGNASEGAGRECRAVANAWLSVGADTPVERVARLIPPSAELLRVEANLQGVRWPSTVRGQYARERDGYGGHAEYLLRVYDVNGDRTLAPALLEDVPRDDADKERLVQWISQNLDGIDRGTAKLPADLSAKAATSVSPRGRVRAANEPWKRLLGDDAMRARLSSLPLGGRANVGSVNALLERLDGATCQGCHQSRAIAGFHLLGEERDEAERLNALAVGASPHLLEQLAYRTGRLRALAAGERGPAAPKPHALKGHGEYGAPCGLGDPGFSSWTCASGLSCVDTNGDLVGTCQPAAVRAGDVCAPARLVSSAGSRSDSSVSMPARTCTGTRAICANNFDGFPDGMCIAACDNLALGKFTQAADGSIDRICGAVPFGSFNTCLFEERRPFRHCLETTGRPTMVKGCDAAHPCRDDYVCVRTPNAPPDKGACMPPYFIFQGRVDGHALD